MTLNSANLFRFEVMNSMSDIELADNSVFPGERIFIKRFEHGQFLQFEETIVSEGRIAVFINGEETIRLLALPIEVENLVTGFLLSECFIDSFEEVKELSFNQRSLSVEVTLSQPRQKIQFEPVRSVTSGCGRGVTFVSPLNSSFFPPVTSETSLPASKIIDLMRKMQRNSPLFSQTGGVHSAAVANGSEILYAADDIGRHNAVDKVLGWMLRSCYSTDNDLNKVSILATTGRLSSEIVTKAVRGRFPFLISPSAPTLGAVQLGEALGVTIIGFARGQRFNVYTHPDRVISP